MALVCLGIVHRLRPAWVALPLRAAAEAEGVSAERLSRLCSRALEGFEAVVGKLTRKGRPPKGQGKEEIVAELAITRALLEVAAAMLATVKLRRSHVGNLVVGAWQRLRESHAGLTQRRFCDALGVSARTLRSWLESPPKAPAARPKPTKPAVPKPPRKRPLRRPRFTFDVVVPGTQYAADTTGLRAFGVDLELVAVQDVGGRDVDLLDAVVIDTTESAEHVAKVLTDALTAKEGAQLLTDQGTPYLAQATRDLLDSLAVEHAPQREADPQGKSTVERAFGSCKDLLAPVLQLTDKLASAVPSLADADLARATTTVLLTLLLRAYQAGARAARRADDQRAGLDAETLARAAAEQRARARADDDSCRLLLERVHSVYRLPGSVRAFVRDLRRFGVRVLRDAETRFGTQVHRDDIKDRKSYFAAIARSVALEHGALRARQQADLAVDAHLDHLDHDYQRQRSHWYQHPADWLRDSLDAFAAQWRPAHQQLLFGGAGVGHAWLAGSLERLVLLHGDLAADVVRGVTADWAASRLDDLGHAGVLGHAGIAAVLDIVRPYADALPTLDTTANCPARFLSSMIPSTGPPSRPAPP